MKISPFLRPPPKTKRKEKNSLEVMHAERKSSAKDIHREKEVLEYKKGNHAKFIRFVVNFVHSPRACVPLIRAQDKGCFLPCGTKVFDVWLGEGCVCVCVRTCQRHFWRHFAYLF